MEPAGLILIRGLILILAAAFGVSVGFASSAFAQEVNSGSGAVIVNPDGKVTYLGTLGGGYSGANGINDAGQVVGSSNTPEEYHAFITGPDGVGMTGLGTLGGTDSSASDINDAGQVAGGSSAHAFITGPNGVGMTDLGTLGGHSSFASGINDAGQVVGWSYIADGTSHAFITGPNGVGMTDLGTLGGDFSHATGINDSGQVAGYSATADGHYHAFITGPNGVGTTDLGTLGGHSSFARGINDAGQVAGYSYTAGDNSIHAFITGPDGKGMIDVNSYADLPDGIVLPGASGINNLGQIIATAIPAPIIPIPEPASYALMLAGLGLVGFMARRKKPADKYRCVRLKPAGNAGVGPG